MGILTRHYPMYLCDEIARLLSWEALCCERTRYVFIMSYVSKLFAHSSTRFFLYKNTENGARLDVPSISKFQRLKMFLKWS